MGRINDSFWPDGRPRIIDDPEDLLERVEDYFASCEPKLLTIKGKDGEETPILDKNGNPTMRGKTPTIAGLALHLGYCSRQSIYDIRDRKDDDRFSYIIKKAVLFLESHWESNLENAACTGAIYWLKNHGWHDKTEVDHTSQGRGLSSLVNEFRSVLNEG